MVTHDSSFDDSHRALVQAFMAQPVMSVDQVKEIVAEIVSIHNGEEITTETLSTETLYEYLSQISDKLSSLDYEIRSIMTQPDGKGTHLPENLYLLVNTASDQFTQLATSFTADELAFVKRVLDAMFDTNNTPEAEIMAVRSTEAISLARRTGGAGGTQTQTQGPMNSFLQTQTQTQSGGDDTMADISTADIELSTQPAADSQQAQTQPAAGTSSSSGITLDRAEKILDILVDEGWFLQSRAGYFSLAPRGIVELRSWLVETYNYTPEDEDDGGTPEDEVWQRIKTCEACKEIVTVGQRCDQIGCVCRFHNHCAFGFFAPLAQQQQPAGGSSSNPRAIGLETACPKCKEPWTGTKFVGERAARGR